MPCQFPEIPPQPTRPVDHVEMADVLERAFVSTPFTARHADEAVVRSFERLDYTVRLSEHGKEVGLGCRAVREVPVRD